MKRLYFTIDNEAQTAQIAASFASFLRVGDVLCLQGDLGVGKTTFTHYFLKELGHIGDVPSPTFTVVQHYDLNQLRVAHYDLYRLEDEAELQELGLPDSFADAINLVEWPSRMGSLLPSDVVVFGLKHCDDAPINSMGDAASHKRLAFIQGEKSRIAGISWPNFVK